MKISVLIQKIKQGFYDVNEDIDDDEVKLPKQMVLELLRELQKRRRVMSRPRGTN